MEIVQIFEHKKRYLDLLLLADEQESMIDKYLERGDMFAVFDDVLVAECVVTDEGHGVHEIKNIATDPAHQRKGYGKRLIEYIAARYEDRCSMLLVGTGDCPASISFYKSCGFEFSHRLEGFFTDNYDHPIFEDGIQLIDMIYLKRMLAG